MIAYRFQNNLIYAYLLLTTLLHAVAAQSFCSTFYGVPDSKSCNELLHGDTGIGNTDLGDHLFGLPHILRPPHTTDEQWDNKVNLSIIRANRKPISPSNQHLLSPCYGRVPQGRCQRALRPILSPTPGVSTDTSHYPPIADAGDRIQASCINPHSRGGHCRTGTNARLLLVLYARDSNFDNRVRRKLALNEPVVAIETESGRILPGLASGDDSDAGSTTGPLDLVAVS